MVYYRQARTFYVLQLVGGNGYTAYLNKEALKKDGMPDTVLKPGNARKYSSPNDPYIMHALNFLQQSGVIQNFHIYLVSNHGDCMTQFN